MKTVLFVCTGNTCRSPMAEAIYNQMSKERGKRKTHRALSAGVYPVPGDPATAGAVNAAQTMYNLNLKAHASRLLEYEDMKNAWLVLAMTRRHVEMIKDSFPDLEDRIFTLKEFAGYDIRDWDISDPYGTDDAQYEVCAAEIYEAMEAAEDRLFELALDE